MDDSNMSNTVLDALGATQDSAAAAGDSPKRNGGGEAVGAEMTVRAIQAALDASRALELAEATRSAAGAQDTAMEDAADVGGGEGEPSTLSSFTAFRDDGATQPEGSASAASASQAMPESSPDLLFTLPTAGQRQPSRPRLHTPPRNSSYSTTMPSSGSSQHTLVAGTQQTAISPSNRPSSSFSSTFQPTPTQLAGADSPDPLAIVPTQLSARSTASFHSRSSSREPSAPLQSSPTRSTRHRSKTPSTWGSSLADGTGAAVAENVAPSSSTATVTGKGRRPLSGASSQGVVKASISAKESDDDELMMEAPVDGPVKPFGGGRASGTSSGPSSGSKSIRPRSEAGFTSEFELKTRKKSTSRSVSRSSTPALPVKAETETDDKICVAPPAPPAPAAAVKKAPLKRRPSGLEFEGVIIPIERKASPSHTRTVRRASGSSSAPSSSEKPTSPRPSSSLTDPASSLASTAAFPAAPPPIASTSSHPLSQNVALQNRTTASVPPSSPLTSVLATSPARPKRARASQASDAVNPSSSGEEAEEIVSTSHTKNGHLAPPSSPPAQSSSSSIAGNPSPKKKTKTAAKKRTVPTVKKKTATTGRIPKAAQKAEEVEEEDEKEEELDEGSNEEEAGGVEETTLSTKKPAPKPKRKLFGGTDSEAESDVDPQPSTSSRRAGAGRSVKMAEVSSDSQGEGESSSLSSSSSSSEDDDESDGYQAPKQAKKKAAGSGRVGRPPKSATAAAGAAKGKGNKASFAVEKEKKQAAKGKDKGKGKEKETVPSTDVASSSPLPLRRTSQFLRPSSSFGPETACVETAEQRAKGWSLNTLPTGKPIWAHVRKEGEEDGFWWPAEVHGKVWEKPLQVRLYLDDSSAVLAYTEEIVSFPSPTSEDVLTFRNPSKLRFDGLSFRDLPSPSSSSTSESVETGPSEEAFSSVLTRAIEKDAKDDDDDSDDDPLPPSSFAAGFKLSQSKKSVAAESSGDDDDVVLADVAESEDSEDELLKADDERAGFVFPSICIAKNAQAWWPASVTGYEHPAPASSPVKNGAKSRKPPKGKFLLAWTDQTTAKLPRTKILLPTDKQFNTVKLGETYVDLPPKYHDRLRDHVKGSVASELFQSIISGTFAPTRAADVEFYAGGARRRRLAETAVYGEYPDSVIDLMGDGVRKWQTSGGVDGKRPVGSELYESLTPSERATYGADVILAAYVLYNFADDQGLGADALENLKEKGKPDPSDEEVDMETYKIAREQLESRSVTKAVHAIRAAKSINSKSKAQRDR